MNRAMKVFQSILLVFSCQFLPTLGKILWFGNINIYFKINILLLVFYITVGYVIHLWNCLFVLILHPVFTALTCTGICGKLKQIDAGSGSVVGVNDQNEAFVLNDNLFTKIGISLKHFSVGPAGQYGVNSADKIFKLQGSSFVQFPGEKRNDINQYMLNQSLKLVLKHYLIFILKLIFHPPVDCTVRPSQTGGCWRWSDQCRCQWEWWHILFKYGC